MSFFSSLDCEAKNFPKGSKVSPFALQSIVLSGSKLTHILEELRNLQCSFTCQMLIVESVEQEAKCKLSGLQATSDIALQRLPHGQTYFYCGDPSTF